MSWFTIVDVDSYVAGYLDVKKIWVFSELRALLQGSVETLAVAEQVALRAKYPVVLLFLMAFFAYQMEFN